MDFKIGKMIIIIQKLSSKGISAFHDENDNKKMDTNVFGNPKEPAGCSNGEKEFMGPPKYKDAKFSISADIVMQN